MSIRLMSAVFDRGPLHPAQRLMMLALADAANDQGVCWPSVATLAEKCSVVPRTAQRTLANLETDGWIETRSGGTNRTNVYQLRLDRLDPSLAGQPAMPSAGAPVRPTPDTHVTPDKTVTLTPTSEPLTPTSPKGDAHVAEGRRPRHPNHKEPSGTITEPSSGRGSATPTATATGDVELDQQAASPAPAKPKAKRATTRPPDFDPSVDHQALADRLGVDLAAEWPGFCDFHDAKGSTFRDWDAALRTWIRNAKKFARPTPARTGNPSGVDWTAAAARARARDADAANQPPIRGELT